MRERGLIPIVSQRSIPYRYRYYKYTVWTPIRTMCHGACMLMIRMEFIEVRDWIVEK